MFPRQGGNGLAGQREAAHGQKWADEEGTKGLWKRSPRQNKGERMEVKKELLDELIKGYEKPEDLIGETGLLKQLTKALIER